MIESGQDAAVKRKSAGRGMRFCLGTPHPVRYQIIIPTRLILINIPREGALSSVLPSDLERTPGGKLYQFNPTMHPV